MKEKEEPKRRLSPGIQIALTIWALTFLAHAFGLRDFTSVLSGTPVVGVPQEAAVLGGMTYVVLWLLATSIAPVALVAAMLGISSDWVRSRSRH